METKSLTQSEYEQWAVTLISVRVTSTCIRGVGVYLASYCWHWLCL